MSHFSPVCSLNHLRQLQEKGALSEYLVIPSMSVLEDPEGWREARKSFWGRKTLLVGAMASVARSLGAEQIVQANDHINADWVLLPSVTGHLPLTIALAMSVKDQIQAIRPDCETYRSGLVGVIQGTTVDEYLDCAQTLITHCGCSRLAIPATATGMIGSRIFLALALAERFRVPIYLLGMSDNLADDIAAARCSKWVFGLDGDQPLRAGQLGRSLETLSRQPLGPCPPQWIGCEEPLSPTSIDNLKLIQELIRR